MTEEELNIEMFNVEPVLIDTSPRDSSTYVINPVISNNLTDRLKILKKSLQLNHLNKEEKFSILYILLIIKNYNDIL